jgi:hypothetical protein
MKMERRDRLVGGMPRYAAGPQTTSYAMLRRVLGTELSCRTAKCLAIFSLAVIGCDTAGSETPDPSPDAQISGPSGPTGPCDAVQSCVYEGSQGSGGPTRSCFEWNESANPEDVKAHCRLGTYQARGCDTYQTVGGCLFEQPDLGNCEVGWYFVWSQSSAPPGYTYSTDEVKDLCLDVGRFLSP